MKCDDVLLEFAQSSEGTCTICAPPLMALAHDGAGRRDSAVPVYEAMVVNRTYWRMVTDRSS